MASDTDTANPDPAADRPSPRPAGSRGFVWPLASRLGRTIVVLNLLGLVVLLGGELALSGLRQGLINTRLDSLTLQGELIANVIDQTATVGEPAPALEADAASTVLQSLFIPRSQRARLYDARGRLLADSFVVADRVEASVLPPARKPGDAPSGLGFGALRAHRIAVAKAALAREVASALSGATKADLRPDENGSRVVSVSIPIEHVRAVLGVLTLEAGDVEQIIAAERRALTPFIIIAVVVALISSILLTQLVAAPVLRLARAADRVRLSRSRAIDLPDLAGRGDELGDLARSLQAMTGALSERMEAIERFAADVAHELRNPMTSIRSAVETLDLVKATAPRERLMRVLQQDVGRMDRLITDISNASRLDAELARESPSPLDLARLLGDIAALYQATTRPDEPQVVFQRPPPGETWEVLGREGPLSQVFRNLIDNARSFSPVGGEVRVRLEMSRDKVIATVDDDGPGIPPENLETVFQRFYTARPRGAAFGGNSGLGLAIVRQIVETHGGQVWAENRDLDGAVAGARFTVALPRA